MTWLEAFLLTVVIELPLVTGLAPRRARRRVPLDVFAINLCTHPLAWLAVVHLGVSWWLVESAVLLAELALYRAVTGLTWPRAALVASVANGVTAGVAWFLYG
jgi:hypothetical protein